MASIRRLSSGKYQVQIRIKGMQPVNKSFATKRSANAFIKQVEGDTELARKLGKPVTQALTFEQLVESYVSQYEGSDKGKSFLELCIWKA